jgi:GNAT superfamily N-acetyltransferase
MEHVLDNPAWNALTSGNSNLSDGNESVKYFAPEVSPFVGMPESSTENFKLMYQLLPFENTVLYITTRQIDIPAPWKILQCIKAFQMIYAHADLPAIGADMELVPLSDEHVPQMLALTKLTNPGPFATRTIEFGHYQGIFETNQLVAMAGQRLHVSDFMEISAVCTHPDHTGKGYARQLLLSQVQRVLANNGVPFLHVRYDNERAVKVYHDLGFLTRTEIYFYALKKG